MASTTQLFWIDGSDFELMGTLGVAPRLFPPIRRPGDQLGPLRGEVLAETGLEGEVLFTAVGSHDTASAVAAAPAADPSFAYISSGTWCLVGVELDRPVLSEESRAARFTNERGGDGMIIYHRTVMGLWLLQESIKTWERGGALITIEELVSVAAGEEPLRSVFEPSELSFTRPATSPLASRRYVARAVSSFPRRRRR
jgi:rhamnulokinase